MKINIRRALAITSIAALGFAIVPALDVTPADAATHHHRAPGYAAAASPYARTPYGGYNNVGPGCTVDLGYGRFESCDG